MTDQHRELRLAARDLLRGSGPLTAGELAERLRDESHEPGDPALLRARLFEVNDERGDPTVFTAFPVPGGRLADIDHLLDGLVLTHELRPDERRAGAADVDDDLVVVPLASLDGRTVPLADGGTLDIVVSEGLEARLTGPEGWLPDAPLLVVTFVDGRLAITGATDVADADPDVAGALRDAWLWLVDEGEDHDLASLVVVARMRNSQLLSSPAAPLEELLDAADLWVDDHGSVWDLDDDGLDDSLDDGLTAHLLDDHGLTEEQVGDLLRIDIVVQEASNQALRGIHARLGEAIADDEHREEALEELTTTLGREHARAMVHHQVEDEVTAALAAMLGDLDATEAFLHDLVGEDPLRAMMTLTLLDDTPLDLSRRDRANQHWLRARLLEFVSDDHTEAERELVRARGLDDAHPELLYDLAGYKEDRGDAGAALGLLRQVTGVDPDRLAMLEHFARPGPTSAGRNDPCPCGSGRKHKVCCAPRNGWPLTDRADWVREKLVRHHGRPSTSQVLDGGLVLADLALGDDDHDDDGLDDLAVLVLCVSLFEGGVAAHFADVRGALLPADELALVQSLAEARAGAYEVSDVGSSGRIELVDLRTGDHLHVEDRVLPGAVSVGQHLLGWVAATDDGPEAQYGMVAVPEGASPSLLEVLDDEPGVSDLLAWFAGHQATS